LHDTKFSGALPFPADSSDDGKITALLADVETLNYATIAANIILYQLSNTSSQPPSRTPAYTAISLSST